MRSAFAFALAAVLALGPATSARSQTPSPAPVPPVQAEDSVLEARTKAIASVLRCPVCQGESIQASPSELAQQMKAVVREQLREGKTPDEIKAYFVARYGEWILLEPAMTGLNLLLYAFPILLVIGGIALVAVVVKRWTTASASASASPTLQAK